MFSDTAMLALIAIVVLGLATTGSGLVLMMRDLRARTAATPDHGTGLPDAALSRIELGMMQQAEAMSQSLAAIGADVMALKADVEWLTGERMIETAINLARTGQSPAEVAANTGLSEDAARTIALFRHN
ncbi:MAG: hypothetical protein A3D16_03440 [Rhodobacterales bacterium RIFCSPHIGHO2_02_FULL_62_130]|jgi:hypothetical protein|nr:MAG: hypothetical protein A3D16_03440 [Rhodobacterales bacterium RIFCSPHIGHO2_02_FULL_62_130]OHC55987.1 MAG: hypothetical protein A3E48_08810 [Rhodobacterales bacterium RIFCSPHIGHO2_12_FULL_62_75]HCY99912.1 hypothetical protein [Rhodobacter sp.]